MHGCYSLAVAVLKVKSIKESSISSILLLLCKERLRTIAEDLVIAWTKESYEMMSSCYEKH